MDTDLYTDDSVSPHAWMITFSDLLMLLLTLFVLRLSMARLDGASLRQDLSRFPHYRGGEAPARSAPPPREPDDIPLSVRKTFGELEDALRSTLGGGTADTTPRSAGFGKDAHLAAARDGVIVTLFGPPFPEGSDELTFRGVESVRALGRALARGNSDVTVAGHAARFKSATGEIGDTWALSSARAAAVMRQLIDAGVPSERMSVIGYGRSKPFIEPDGHIDDEKSARIEIIIRSRPRV